MNENYIARVSLKHPVDPRSYLARLPVVQYLMKTPYLAFSHPVTFLVGENGTGKSTLLEAIAVAYGFNAEGGSRNFSFSTRDTHSKLYESIAISRRRYPKDTFFLRAESFYNVASQVDDLENDGPPGFLQGFGGRSLHAQSHGESFLSLVQNRFRGQGLYLLDEPEAALSPSKILTLIAQIDYLVKNDSQFLIATHSPMLMAYPNAQIYVLSEQGIEETPYEQTEHYLLTKRFLNDPERMLRYLLEEDEE